MERMGSEIGALLVDRALVPVRAAAFHLGDRRVVEGLETLAAERLQAALREGIAAEAKRAGLDDAEVLRALPVEEIDATLARFDRSCAAALEAWRLHRKERDSSLPGVGDVSTLDAPPDVGWYLGRLASKVAHDGLFSGPMEVVAADVARWEQLVLRCGAILRDHPALLRAYRLRRLRAGLVTGVAAAVALYAVVSGARVLESRKRVAAALAAEPCVALQIAPADLARATPAQRQSAAEHGAACLEVRAREQRIRDEQRAREAREAACDALAAALAAGRATPEVITAAAPEKAELITRIAQAALLPADFEATRLACEDTRAAARIWKSMAWAAGRSAEAWATVTHISDPLRALLITPELQLGEASKKVLSERAEASAQKAVLLGDPALLADAGVVCELARDLGADDAMWCKGALSVLAKRAAAAK